MPTATIADTPNEPPEDVMNRHFDSRVAASSFAISISEHQPRIACAKIAKYNLR